MTDEEKEKYLLKITELEKGIRTKRDRHAVIIIIIII